MTDFKKILTKQKRTGKFIKNFITNSQKSRKDSELKAVDVRARAALLKNYWDDFFANEQILSNAEEDKDIQEYFENESIEIPFFYTIAKAWLDERLIDIEGIPSTPISPTIANVVNNNAYFQKIKLPSFDGQQRAWDAFKDKFSALIIQDVSIPPIIKFHHLLNCLEGDAATHLQGYEVVGVKFDEAWKHLCATYDNRFLRFGAHANAILQLPTAAKETAAHLTQIITTTIESCSAFKALQLPVDSWDTMLIHLLQLKLAPETDRAWVRSIDTNPTNKDFPTFEQFREFIQKRIREASIAKEPNATSSSDSASISRKPKAKFSNSSSIHLAQPVSTNQAQTSSKKNCKFCTRNHTLTHCEQFAKIPVVDRRTFVREQNLCFNCMGDSHQATNCKVLFRCFVCRKAHHTKLHTDVTETDPLPELSNQETVVALTHSLSCTKTPVAARRGILSTALVTLENHRGQTLSARALLDSGAEECIISDSIVEFLGLPRIKEHAVLNGAGGNSTAVATYRSEVIVKSPITSKFALQIKPLVLKRVSSLIPPTQIRPHEWFHLKDLQLADPHFGSPSRVDCILGSVVFGQVILPEIKRDHGNIKSPVAFNTLFGWVLTGAANSSNSNRTQSNVHLTVNAELSHALERLWEIEEPPRIIPWTPKEEQCVEHFKRTHYRDQQGRFVVRLPFSEPPSLIGTKGIAQKCFQRLENRLKRDVELSEHYCRFIDEYENLGHLQIAPNTEMEGAYLPHHPVWKKESRKIRVVFNASQGDQRGRSLNSFLHTGPKLQLDIFAILCRWAFFQFVFTCDIIKMFRQFLVHPEDRKWQRIVWRTQQTAPLRHLELSTVTYGTACAPYLANACLLELADRADVHHKSAAIILRHHRYVDDFFFGANSVAESEAGRHNLLSWLKGAGMETDKLTTNYGEFLEERFIPVSDYDTVDKNPISVLGLSWDPLSDTYRYKFQFELQTKITKRSILSITARLFDPVGWISPVIVRAKIIMQSLWMQGSDWDAQVPISTQTLWLHFYEQLAELSSIRVPRWVHTQPDCYWEIQGFADASERAYAAVVYILAEQKGHRVSTLLTSKTKVAPIKTLQLPRLELCAAHLLAKLLKALLTTLLEPPHSITCWSDSTNVLTWLSSHPSKWQTFIANRASEIHSLLPGTSWMFVRSGDNPADLASRGCSPAELQQSLLWWKGPEWLESDPQTWNVSTPPLVETLEEKRKRNAEIFLFLSVEDDEFISWIKRFSSADRIIAIWAYCIRWFNVTRRKTPRPSRRFLTAEELEVSRLQIVRLLQRNDFPEEITKLEANEAVAESSKLKRLCPFLDNHGVMRVGGRLDNALLMEETKHPAILDPSNHFSDLLIRRAHKLTLHGGVSVVQGFLAQQYWIDKGRNTIRCIVQNCTVCLRHNAHCQEQRMAPLPPERVRPSRPFTFTGLDYAGPFSLKKSPGRGAKTYKGYVAIFVCMAVKAIHLETVSEYTTSAFMAALRRFTARRGMCKVLFSDNGTNFQGAAAELRRLFRPASAMVQEIASLTAREGIDWKFIPPRAPHFGGLWESNIRSVKRHLNRVLGSTKLTYEEFSTVLTQVEACLNSRPLYQMSSDGNDFSSLTPGHFLIGSALKGIPDTASASTEDFSLNNRWKTLQQILSSFWKRWRTEYLCTLQQRQKWLKPRFVLKVGDLVIIKDGLLPPTQWLLGRVTSLYPGRDGLIRVASIKTATTELTRPISKLIYLPVSERQFPDVA